MKLAVNSLRAAELDYEPQKFKDLSYTPIYGQVAVRYEDTAWLVDVPVAHAVDMEKHGVTVYWIHSRPPARVIRAGFLAPYTLIERMLTWPGRFFR